MEKTTVTSKCLLVAFHKSYSEFYMFWDILPFTNLCIPRKCKLLQCSVFTSISRLAQQTVAILFPPFYSHAYWMYLNTGRITSRKTIQLAKCVNNSFWRFGTFCCCCLSSWYLSFLSLLCGACKKLLCAGWYLHSRYVEFLN